MAWHGMAWHVEGDGEEDVSVCEGRGREGEGRVFLMLRIDY